MPRAVETERWKLRVSESRGKVYFYYAEREQFQSHAVRLKLKTEKWKLVQASERKFIYARNERSQGSSAQSAVETENGKLKSERGWSFTANFKFSVTRELFLL